MAHELTNSVRDQTYSRIAQNLAGFELSIVFYDESETLGVEEDGQPTLFAEVTHATAGVLTQRPARELAAFAWGYQAAHVVGAH